MENWKKNRKTVTTTCKTCGESFKKIKSEYDRTELRSGNHYCSRSCCGKDNIKKNLSEWYGKGDVSRLRSNNQRDKYTGFREFIRRAKQRNNLGDLTLDDLLEQWEKQNGICPYTGIELKLPNARGRNSKGRNCELVELASLDRIKSSRPYEKNNMVFVSTPTNYMKNTMTEEETVAFCKKIALFWKNK